MIKSTIADNGSAIAVIRTNIQYIQRDINDIKEVLKDGYATKDSLAEVARDTEKRITVLENSSNLWRWLSPSMSAVLGSLLTFLLIQYLMSQR